MYSAIVYSHYSYEWFQVEHHNENLCNILPSCVFQLRDKKPKSSLLPLPTHYMHCLEDLILEVSYCINYRRRVEQPNKNHKSNRGNLIHLPHHSRQLKARATSKYKEMVAATRTIKYFLGRFRLKIVNFFEMEAPCYGIYKPYSTE